MILRIIRKRQRGACKVPGYPVIHSTAAEPLQKRLREPRRFIQIVAGPRQTGKTTLVRQVLETIDGGGHYASADTPTLRDQTWVRQQWEIGRLRARSSSDGAILALDEVQKIPGWSEVVKELWDEDTARGVLLRVILLGSSPLLMQQGMTESLAGRFERLVLSHWSYGEMRDAFGWTLDQYLYFGGYPGAASLIDDERRWAQYIQDALIETTISRDILLMTRVDKPALLWRLFHLGCVYSGQILSYTKMLGQLQDAGNTTTLAHYLDLLSGAGMMTGLSKYTGEVFRRRGSSPKLQVLNTALLSAQAGRSLTETLQDRDAWGRLVESAVGAHLFNDALASGVEVFYWRERSHEVDFILRRGTVVTAIEVKSGRKRERLAGMDAFLRAFRPQHQYLVGAQGIPLEEFLSSPITRWVG